MLPSQHWLVFADTSCCWGNPVLPPQRAKPPSLACCCLHVAGQSADLPLTGSTGQQDGDDGQQRAEGQQGTASRTQHGARLEGHTGQSARGFPAIPTTPPHQFPFAYLGVRSGDSVWVLLPVLLLPAAQIHH